MSSTLAESLSSTVEESITRLAAFEPSTFPVVSVYLNTEPDQHGRTPDVVPYLHREFKALARTFMRSSPKLHSFERDAERVLSYAAEKIDSGAHGVAIFACWGAEEFFEAIQLTTPFGANHVSADNQPICMGWPRSMSGIRCMLQYLRTRIPRVFTFSDLARLSAQSR